MHGFYLSFESIIHAPALQNNSQICDKKFFQHTNFGSREEVV